MELSVEFKEYIKYKYFHHRSSIRNPSALTVIFYLKGYEGRYGMVRASIEDELKKIASDEGKRLKELKELQNK